MRKECSFRILLRLEHKISYSMSASFIRGELDPFRVIPRESVPSIRRRVLASHNFLITAIVGSEYFVSYGLFSLCNSILFISHWILSMNLYYSVFTVSTEWTLVRIYIFVFLLYGLSNETKSLLSYLILSYHFLSLGGVWGCDCWTWWCPLQWLCVAMLVPMLHLR